MLLHCLQGRPVYDLESGAPAAAEDVARAALGPVASASYLPGLSETSAEVIIGAYAATAGTADISRKFGGDSCLWLATFLQFLSRSTCGAAPFSPASKPLLTRSAPVRSANLFLNCVSPGDALNTGKERKADAEVPLHCSPDSSLFINALGAPKEMRVLCFTHLGTGSSGQRLLVALKRIKAPLVLSQRILPLDVKELLRSAGAIFFERFGLQKMQQVTDTLQIHSFQGPDDFVLAVGTTPSNHADGICCVAQCKALEGTVVLCLSRTHQPTPLQPRDVTVAPLPLRSPVPAALVPLVDAVHFRVVVALCVLLERCQLRHGFGDEFNELVQEQRCLFCSHGCEPFISAIALASRVLSTHE